MKIKLMPVTDRGYGLGRKLIELTADRHETVLFPPLSAARLRVIAGENWVPGTALVFIGALGIGVRVIAPLIRDKFSDPAVIVADEQGSHFISVLAGHWGGANELALELAELYGSQAVITTATDLLNRVGMDVLGRRYRLKARDTETYKRINSVMAKGEPVHFFSTGLPEDFPYSWQFPDDAAQASGCKVLIDPFTREFDGYVFYPPAFWVGVGVKRGVPARELDQALVQFLAGRGIPRESIIGLASIDLKQDEPGILELAYQFGWQTRFFTSAELERSIVKYELTCSERVNRRIGVGNVCEAAALMAVQPGRLVLSKTNWPGISLAVAERSPWWAPAQATQRT